MIDSNLVREMLEEPGLERLRDWYEIGPVQRAAVEQLVQLAVDGCTIAAEDHDIESFGVLPVRADNITRSCQRNIQRWANGEDDERYN